MSATDFTAQTIAYELPVAQLVKHRPVVCFATDSISLALTRMHLAGVGSIVIVEADKNEPKPVGILSRHDLIDRVILSAIDLTLPMHHIMSTPVQTASHTTTIAQALVHLAHTVWRHLVLVDNDGVLIGVISERDLVAHHRFSIQGLHQSIEASESLQDLGQCVLDIKTCAKTLLTQGMHALPLTRLISHLNDAITRRVIALSSPPSHPELRWAWLALGSEGREEQTISTDQDNAVMYAWDDCHHAQVMPLAIKTELLQFAARVNSGLDVIGFPLCTGQVMAQFPAWCQSLQEWSQECCSWFLNPTPEAILRSHIFLDFRVIAGDVQLAQTLRADIHQYVTPGNALIRHWSLALDARQISNLPSEWRLTMYRLLSQLPLPSLQTWVNKHCLRDLKYQGTALMMDALRCLSLHHKVSQTASVDRISELSPPARTVLTADDAIDLREGLACLNQLRLTAQLSTTHQGGQRNPNQIDLRELSHHERMALRDAIGAIQKLRQQTVVEVATHG